jgi:hypothetical protein
MVALQRQIRLSVLHRPGQLTDVEILQGIRPLVHCIGSVSDNDRRPGNRPFVELPEP